MQDVRPREGPATELREPPRTEPAPRPGLLDRWQLVIGLALVLRFGLVAALLGTDLVTHNGWYFPNDDQIFFWGMSHALATDGSIVTAPTTLGYSVLLVPFSFASEFVLQAIPPVAIVQTLLCVPLAYLLYRAGERLLDARSAVLGTAFWLVSPALLGPIFVPSYAGRFEPSPGWLGLEIAVDWASAALVIALVYAASFARARDGIPLGLAVGALGGLLFLAKPNNLIVVVSVLAGLLVWRRRRATLTAFVALAAVSAPQFAYNFRLYREPFTFAYSKEFGQWDLVSLSYVPRVFGKLIVSNYTGPLLLLGAVTALAVTWLRFPSARWLIVAPTIGMTLFFSTLYYSISGNFLRYLGPVLPLVCLAAGAALVGRRRRAVVSEREPGPGKIAAGVCAATVAGAVALTVWVGLAPTSAAIPVVESMAPSATVRDDGSVLIRWHAPDAPADLMYDVRRTRSKPGPTRFGFGNDPGEPSQKGFFAFERTALTNAPGPGVWWYRVAINPGPTPHGWPPGVTLAFSEPVRVVVPPRG